LRVEACVCPCILCDSEEECVELVSSLGVGRGPTEAQSRGRSCPSSSVIQR